MSASIRLYCFAHAGASAAPYLRWRRRLPASIEVVPVELPGRGRRRDEPLTRTLAAALDAVEGELAPLTRPYALFGHSLGATLAFACAQRLRARGAPAPRILFASASHAPCTRTTDEGTWSDEALREELTRLDGTPTAVLGSPELLELALPVLRADYQLAADAHRSLVRAPIAAPIHVLAGTHDEIAASALAGWRACTESTCELSYFAGGHFYLREHEDALLALLARELARTAGQAASAEIPRVDVASIAASCAHPRN